MLGQHSLEALTREAGIAARPRYLEVTGSTNTEAVRLADAGAPEFTVVVAGHQTGGRGRLGRTWADEPGTALLVSVILRPPLPPDHAGLVSLVAATEMSAACRTASGVTTTCTWPNDLVVGDRKVGGILAEGRVTGGTLEHLVLGIGVNVTTPRDAFPAEIRDRATSLQAEGGRATPEKILGAFLARFRSSCTPGDPAWPGLVVRRYREGSSTLGRRVRATTREGEVVEGTALDVDERGGLVVEAGDTTRTVAFGEIAHLD